MASLSDSERWENVKGSLEKYAYASFVTAESLVCDVYDGAKFDSAAQAYWTRFRCFRLAARQSFRAVGSGNRGTDARVLVQFDAFVKVDLIVGSLSGNVRRADELVDLGHKYLKEGTSIPVYQLQSGGTPATEVATLFCMVSRHLRLPDEGDEGDVLQRRSYEATFRWDEVLAA